MGTWKSKDKVFENGLNATSTPAQITEYTPDKQAAVLELAKKNFPKLEVLENSRPKPLKVFPEMDF